MIKSIKYPQSHTDVEFPPVPEDIRQLIKESNLEELLFNIHKSSNINRWLPIEITFINEDKVTINFFI